MNGEEGFDYLELRARKITSALYRVTDLLSEKEPLKWALRAVAVEALNVILELRSQPLKERSGSVPKASYLVSKALSLLELAEGGSFISRMNFEVLSREYLSVKEILPSPVFLLEDKKIDNLSIGHDIGHLIGHSSKDMGVKEEERPESALAMPLKPEEIRIPEDASTLLTGSSGRKEIILDHLRKREWASVGELVSVFKPGLSEKTLQRDLLRLAEEGVIERRGEKRWRRYALKNPENNATD